MTVVLMLPSKANAKDEAMAAAVEEATEKAEAAEETEIVAKAHVALA